MVWDTPTTDTTDSGPTLLPPSSTMASALTAMLPPTPMVPTGISARGPLMLSPRLMLMLTTAPWATIVVDGGSSVGPESVESVVGVSQTVVAQGAVVSISISLGLSISGPLAEMPVGTIGVGGSIAVRAN